VDTKQIFEGTRGWIPHEQVEEQSIAATERGCVQRTRHIPLTVSGCCG
jgi:hypothetical protein